MVEITITINPGVIIGLATVAAVAALIDKHVVGSNNNNNEKQTQQTQNNDREMSINGNNQT